ncbi:DUF4192 family protein [Microbacterium sp.]|uniref:DUF4192 family protein n=1 Tax=Microbacterium sp. TaxID=51671 RepID=UPI0037CA4DA5
MTTIIKAADAAQFLALVPRLAGCRPVRSLALVPFGGSRTLGVMRADLPAADADVDSVAATLVGMVCRVREADGLALVVYTDEAYGADAGIARGPLVEALIRKTDACGLRLIEALCVARDGWGSYLEDGSPRHALDDLADDDLVKSLPGDLRAPLPDHIAGAALPDVDLAQRERAAQALRALGEAVEAVCAATGREPAAHTDLARLDPQALAAACALDDLPALFEDALRWDPADLRPADAAAIIWCLARPALRDVALVQWCTGIDIGDAALDAQLRWQGGEDYPAALAQHLWGEGERPDADRLRTALALARHTAALAPRDVRPGPLATAGWLSWALGRSSHAVWYVERATEIDPQHGLTGILAAMLNAGHLPEWVFERPLPSAT